MVAQGKLGALHGSRAIRIAARAGSASSGGFADAEMDGADSDNVFSADLSDSAASLDMSLLSDAPLADADQPDPFRNTFADIEDESEEPAMALPLNFVID